VTCRQPRKCKKEDEVRESLWSGLSKARLAHREQVICLLLLLLYRYLIRATISNEKPRIDDGAQ
jgi:hypothetical protein